MTSPFYIVKLESFTLKVCQLELKKGCQLKLLFERFGAISNIVRPTASVSVDSVTSHPTLQFQQSDQIMSQIKVAWYVLHSDEKVSDSYNRLHCVLANTGWPIKIKPQKF